MADNVTLGTMSGGDSVAADDIAGIKYQRIKLIFGADGLSSGDVSTSNGLPVALLASTAAIGKLAANSGVDIGDVDVLTVPADPFGANADAIVAAGAVGSIQAKLRRMTQGLEDLKTLIVLAAGTNGIGKLTANSGVDIGDIDVTSIVPGSAATNLGKAEDAAHTSGDVGVMALGVGNVAQASFAADGDYIPIATDLKGNVMVGGNIAHDGVDAGNPLLQGYRAIAHGTNPTAVAAADRTVGYSNRAGVPFVIGGHPNILTKNLNVSDADGAQTDTDIIGAIAGGMKYVVTMISVMADNANTQDVAVRIGFGTANTPAADAAGIVVAHPGIAPGSGFVVGDGSAIIGVGADGAELRCTTEDPVGGSVDITVTYYTIES